AHSASLQTQKRRPARPALWIKPVETLSGRQAAEGLLAPAPLARGFQSLSTACGNPSQGGCLRTCGKRTVCWGYQPLIFPRTVACATIAARCFNTGDLLRLRTDGKSSL